MDDSTTKQNIRSPVAAHFLDSLSKATHINSPYDYWLLDHALPESTANAITALPFPPPSGAVFDGRRESNNSSRVFFNAENQKRFLVCRDVALAFNDALVMGALERATGSKLSEGFLRIEYCQDVDGFWLEPHLDISVKLFSLLICLSDDPNLFDAGTDIFDSTPEHRLVASVPYEKGRGVIFIPGENTWHGFSKRAIRGLRKSIIVNYVSSEWRNKDELSF